MSRCFVTVLTAVCIVLPVAPLLASSHVGDMVGRVTDLAPAGKPTIVRADGSKEKARYPAPLFVNDRVVLEPGETLGVVLNGKRQPLRGPIDQRITAPPRAVSTMGTGILDSLIDFLQRPHKPASVLNAARAPGGEVPPTVADPLVPTGRQLLPPGVKSVALLWRGPAGLIALERAGQTPVLVPSHGNSWATFTAPEFAPRGFTIAIRDSGLAWQVAIAPKVPSPTGLEPDRLAGDRLARAVWLLRSGPPEWHLFAVSEVANLAASGDYVAGELWRAAQDGHLETAIGTKA